MMTDNQKTELLKTAAMLLVVAAEWWAMQPYHEPLLARIYLSVAQFCYRIARLFGTAGLAFEYKYYGEVI